MKTRALSNRAGRLVACTVEERHAWILQCAVVFGRRVHL
jgi:hypothetical protein